MTTVGPKIPRVQRGERVKPTFRASTFNAWTDAANWFKENQNVGAEQPRSKTFELNVPSLIDAVNDENTVKGPNNILGLETNGLNPPPGGTLNAIGRVPFGVLDPADKHRGKFAVARDGLVAQDMVGDAAVAGIVYCRLFVETNATWIQWADVDPADPTRLITHPGGSAQILWKENNSPNVEMDAFVRLSAPQYHKRPGKANGDIIAGSGGQVECWDGVPLAATSYDITVSLDWMAAGQNITSGKEVIATWFPDENRWRVTHSECE